MILSSTTCVTKLETPAHVVNLSPLFTASVAISLVTALPEIVPSNVLLLVNVFSAANFANLVSASVLL